MNISKCELFFLPAGQGDCIVIQLIDEQLIYHNILIDGGNCNQSEFINLKKELLRIIDNGNKGVFDLVIISHSDDDHIKGILSMVSDSNIEKYFKNYWFNSEKTIADFFNTEYKNTQQYSTKKKLNTTKSTRQQDNDLYDIISNSNKWNKDLILNGQSINISTAKLTVLSPTKEKLEILNKYWPTKKIRSTKNGKKKGFDYDTTIESFKSNEFIYVEDATPVNGASIAILMEWNGYNFLFTSDSHPSTILNSLKNKAGTDKLDIEVIKVAHHGSKYNTSSELLDLINCRNFVISSNANRIHYHPNKQTLALIINHFGKDNIDIYFNYCNFDIKRIFNCEDFKNIHYPKEINKGIHISYEY